MRQEYLHLARFYGHYFLTGHLLVFNGHSHDKTRRSCSKNTRDILINQLIYLTIGVCLTVLFASKFFLALSHFKLTRQELQNLAVFDTLKMSDRQFSLILK